MGISDLSFEDLLPKPSPSVSSLSFQDLLPPGDGYGAAGNNLPQTLQMGVPFTNLSADTGIGIPKQLAAGMVGAGQATDKLLSGLQQLYYGAKGALGIDPSGSQARLTNLQNTQQQNDALYQPLQQASPWMTGIGQSVPTAAATLLSGGASTIPMAMIKQGLAAAVPEALSYGTLQDRAAKAALSGVSTAAGTGLLGLIGKARTPSTAGALAPDSATVQAAKNIGYNLTPGQVLDSTPLMRFEQGMSQRAGSAPQFETFRANNQAAINNAAAADLGSTLNPVNNEILPQVLNDARQRIGDTLSQITSKVNAKLGTPFMDKLIAIDSASRDGVFPTLRSAGGGNTIDGVINDALDLAANGTLSGKTYDLTRRNLSARASEAFASNAPGSNELGTALNGIVGALDEAAGQSLTQTEQAAFQQARKQWSVLRTLETGNVVQNGNVNPVLVKGQMQKNYSIPYREGTMQGPMVDIARIGEGVKPLRDSGTPGGMLGLQMSTPSGLYDAVMGGPARYLAAKAYLSPAGSSYFSNQFLSPQQKLLMMRGGGLLGSGGNAYINNIVNQGQ